MVTLGAQKLGWDRHLAAAILIGAIVLVARGIIVAHSHGPTRDENYHLYRGLLVLRHDSDLMHARKTKWNDPPFGDALVALPAWLNGVHMLDPILARDLTARGLPDDMPPPLENQYIMPDSIRIETAIWQSLLFLPVIAVIFCWVRETYAPQSAWLAVAMILIEPTVAAHVPLPTLDVLGVSGVVISCWTAWRYVRAPSTKRRWAAAIAMAVAMSLKNSAILLPAYLIALAAIVWIWLPGRRGEKIAIGKLAREALLFGAIAFLTLWACTFGDISTPDPMPRRFDNALLTFVDKIPVPAGLYFRAAITGIRHAHDGHAAILFGHKSEAGWWYYFPVVATFKIPIGLWVVLAIGAVSLVWMKPRFAELPIFLCAAIWTVSLMRQHINIGFRHFLIPEMFWLMLASRCLCVRIAAVSWVAWLATAAAMIDVAMVTPDYLSYINFPRRQWYMQISDSNVDWGQATKELRHWIDAQPDDGRPIYLGYFGPYEQDLFKAEGPRLKEYVMNEGSWISRTGNGASSGQVASLPEHGILVISPILVTGQYDPDPMFSRLRNVQPREVIGHCLLVFDLDDLKPK